jgi:hypothetical protein
MLLFIVDAALNSAVSRVCDAGAPLGAVGEWTSAVLEESIFDELTLSSKCRRLDVPESLEVEVGCVETAAELALRCSMALRTAMAESKSEESLASSARGRGGDGAATSSTVVSRRRGASIPCRLYF